MKRKKQLPQIIWGVSSGNFIIYIISFAVSIVFIGLGFISCESFILWATLFMSVGASGIGAVILAFFIERSNNKRDKQELVKNRDVVIEPIISDLRQIIFIEILIASEESLEFKKKIENKTITEIIEDLMDLYRERVSLDSLNMNNYINYDDFDKDCIKLFTKRKEILKFLGGLFNYAVNDIVTNRSYNITHFLFLDQEIKSLKLLQSYLFNIKASENYSEYLFYYIEFLGEINYCAYSMLNEFNTIKKRGNYFYNKEGVRLLVNHRGSVYSNEI